MTLASSVSIALCCPECGQIWHRRQRGEMCWHFCAAPCSQHSRLAWGVGAEEHIPGSRLALGWIDIEELSDTELQEEFNATMQFFSTNEGVEICQDSR